MAQTVTIKRSEYQRLRQIESQASLYEDIWRGVQDLLDGQYREY